ncbi:MAG: transposase [Planctomycetaceae bacterium]|nr:transposase [Planctomycetaceae bacterium]
MVKRRIYDQDRHAHFVTFSCFRRRRFLHPDRAKRIVIGSMGSQLSRQKGICSGFVVMPDHVHALVWFPEVAQLSPFMDACKPQTSKAIQALFEAQYVEYFQQTPASDPIWQARYDGFNLWSRHKFVEKLEYMHSNPVRAGLVARTTNWKWSSARW